MKYTGSPDRTDCDLDVNVAGQGEVATVNAGENVTISYSGRVWSAPGYPTLIDQVVIGVEATPLACVYDDMPGEPPGTEFSGSLTFKAPSQEGTYRIYGYVDMQYICEDAMRDYPTNPNNRPKFQIATLTVSVPPPPSVPNMIPIFAPLIIGSLALLAIRLW